MLLGDLLLIVAGSHLENKAIFFVTATVSFTCPLKNN